MLFRFSHCERSYSTSQARASVICARLTDDSIMIGAAGNFDNALVEKSEDNGWLALVCDSSEASIILLNLFKCVTKLAELVGAHRIDKATGCKKEYVAFTACYTSNES